MRFNIGDEVIHIKSGGVYVVECYAKMEADLTDVVVYRETFGSKRWVRPAAEFEDGRFQPYPLPRSA